MLDVPSNKVFAMITTYHPIYEVTAQAIGRAIAAQYRAETLIQRCREDRRRAQSVRCVARLIRMESQYGRHEAHEAVAESRNQRFTLVLHRALAKKLAAKAAR